MYKYSVQRERLLREPGKVRRGQGRLPVGILSALRFYVSVVDGGDCYAVDPGQRGFIIENLTT